MPKASPKTASSKIVAAVLRLSAKKGWSGITLEALAKEAKISLASLKKSVKAPLETIPLIVEEITQESLYASKNAKGSPHDILFDLLMARFDAMQKNRKGILALAGAARHNPEVCHTLGRAVWRAMEKTASAAKLPTSRPILATGLSAVYAWAFFAWTRDTTRDMAKTMAALDRALRMAGHAAALIAYPRHSRTGGHFFP